MAHSVDTAMVASDSDYYLGPPVAHPGPASQHVAPSFDWPLHPVAGFAYAVASFTGWIG